jgi:hypothetical protein
VCFYAKEGYGQTTIKLPTLSLSGLSRATGLTLLPGDITQQSGLRLTHYRMAASRPTS